MIHDPLCTTVLNTEMSEEFCNCELIARVREDERGKVNPPPPFPMGASVRGVGETRALTVRCWDFYPAWGKWFVRVETGKVDEEGEWEYALLHPWELELVTYEQGQRDEQAKRYEAQSENWEKGYAAALDAAREALTEALNALPIKWTSDELFPAVLTIHQVFDSLKEKP